MEKEENKFEQLFDDVREYLDAKQELLKLQLVEKTARVVSNIIAFFVILPFFILAFLFISIALAHLFAEFWGHEYAGYLTVTFLYLVIGLLLVRFRKKWLVGPMMNAIIKQILSKETDEQH
jgi:hypothetical protein